MSSKFDMSRIARHGLVYGMGAVATKIVSFFMLPIYTRFLTPADYGVLQLINMSLELIAIFAGSRLASGVFHFYHKAETDRGRTQVLSSAFILLSAAFALAGIVTLFVSEPLAGLLFEGEHVGLIRTAAMTLALTSLIVVPFALLQLREQSGLFVAVTLTMLVLQVTLNIVFVVGFRMGALGVLLSALIVHIVIGAWLGVIFIRRVGWAFSVPAARGLLRFGLPFIGTQLATFFVTFGDRYFLLANADMTTVGVYALSYQFGFLLMAIGYGPYNTIWEPVRFEIARRDDRHAIYSRAFVHFNLLLITMAVLISLFAGDLLRIMAAPEFHAAGAVVPIVVAAYVLQSWTGFHNIGIMYRERTELITAANWIGAVIALGGYIVLIPRYHAYGAATATVMSFAVRELLVYWWSQRLWRVDYQWGPVARLVAIAALVAGVSAGVPQMALWRSILLQLALFGAYALLVWHGRVLSASDRSLVKQAVNDPRSTVLKLRRREQPPDR